MRKPVPRTERGPAGAGPRPARSPSRPLALASLLALALAPAPGCSKQDMVVQPRLKPYQESSFFADGRGARPAVAGTIARGRLEADPAYFTGKLGDLLVERVPATIDRAMLERGRQRYD